MKLFSFFSLLLISSTGLGQDLPLTHLKYPAGFTVSIYAQPVVDAREMALGSKDIVFVGSRNAGKVYAVIPDKKNSHGTRVLTVASGLNMPNGVAFHQGALYVAEVGRILRFDNIESNLNKPPKPTVVTTKLPKEKAHGWRFISFGPDGRLYIGVGAPCNVCLMDDPHYATIMRMEADGQNLEVYAKGIRNTVGFDWDPIHHNLWFTDNGRDWLGDDLPPDELNVAPTKGMDFGFPYCYGKSTADPVYGKLHSCSEFTPPVYEFPAHVAPLGMSFYTGKLFPSNYWGQIFISEHGSWNRSHKIGYQVIIAKIKNNHVTEVKPFISGWLQGEKAWGRPVDTLVMPDGALLISDDYANVIYRVSYQQ
ncbi:PQQ-dependent sugar dehydrogenase [Legionella pneumophila]|uniref:L-sorbosone dehydrogenase n=1 Tax=Legionella pneumophila subsp. pascullei TaxID=91890 RepID=A0AAX2IZQ5_LEGPN|nr:PQQ-dependent sugar dehydrogenase [Legionella pneumophila]AMP90708.1 L-sorbosone dehydrogenase [Legionella pneumophila subsp. pascullei]AMP93691.1 L-sorbosone dehydrogenase [Legionella pneumophila subsp. pascullei]AMP96609.1 L-sorbosone dehydrogenase [Legionella pneumophila subsp. pascullei]SQG91649.1 L-sorbosone dehydrogenase [Legionella pneumophila subsp. pascullei]VEH08195.1 L-sorbosone dehydrogenase [Legionella pneumophila subsp. pascullei]